MSDDELRWAYQHAAALVAPSLEDFGLTPLEAGTFGRPALALRQGGYLDTVADGVSGLFFDRADAAGIADAVRRSRSTAWDEDAITRHTQQFGEATFRDRMRREVETLLAAGRVR